MIAALRAHVLGLQTEFDQLRTLFGNALKIGPVHLVDADRGYRLKLGDGEDGPILSPWYPHPESSKTSLPMKVGQIVGVMNPTGDPRQGFVLRNGYSDDLPSPNKDMEANVFQDAGIRLEVKDGALVLTADNEVTLTVGANIRFKVAKFEVN